MIGDLNAFEFTDGYVDVLGQIAVTVDATKNLPKLVRSFFKTQSVADINDC